MRKIPIPLILAAIVATTAVTIMLNLQVSSIPIVADPNFTGPIPAGNVAVWKAAGFSQATFTPNASITVYGAPGVSGLAVYAPQGLPVNATLDRSVSGSFKTVAVVQIRYGTFIVTNLVGADNNYYYLVYKLVPTSVSGLYTVGTANVTEVNAVRDALYALGYDTVNKFHGSYSATSYDASTNQFIVSWVNPAGYRYQFYVNPTISFTANATKTVNGGVISLNIGGKPVAIAPFYTFAIKPDITSGSVQVVITVK